MTTDPAPATARTRIDAKRALWAVLAVATVWVLLSNEVALLLDSPLFHDHRAQIGLDRALLIPHAVCGTVAFVLGPLQFSSRLRQRRPDLHRLMGRSYVVAVNAAAFAAFAIGWGRPLLPATLARWWPEESTIGSATRGSRSPTIAWPDRASRATAPGTTDEANPHDRGPVAGPVGPARTGGGRQRRLASAGRRLPR